MDVNWLENLRTFFFYPLFHIGEVNITPLKIILFFVILMGARILARLFVRLFLQPLFKRRNFDPGRSYAVTRLVKYMLYVFGIIIAFQFIGIQLSLVVGGLAALLVGIGLGLQQTFNDLVSGIIILIEGTVEVGDIIQTGSLVARVKKIGIRTSEVETRDRTVMIIPNSKLVIDSVVNWSHNASYNRFCVTVGVSYASDVVLVRKLLLQAAANHKKILSTPEPLVQFKDFGDSALVFDLYFFSYEFFFIEIVKSDVRERIFDLFRKNEVEIPFPQRDMWIKNPEGLVK